MDVAGRKKKKRIFNCPVFTSFQIFLSDYSLLTSISQSNTIQGPVRAGGAVLDWVQRQNDVRLKWVTATTF